MRMLKWAAAMVMAALLCVCCAAAQETDAAAAQDWLARFSADLAQMTPVNDAGATADPARPGEYLLEFGFGTVTATRPSAPAAQEILRVEILGDQVTDWQGLRVGMTLEDVIAGKQITQSDTPLYVLSTQESGYGWSWAYVGEQGVYGVETITYGEADGVMREYTMTYVIKDDRIASIRMQVAPATQAQAEEGLRTAEEFAGRQMGELLISENGAAQFGYEDVTVNGRRAIGVSVAELIAVIGEPADVQNLPGGQGRMLLYDGAVVELVFDELTGVENVRAISCADASIAGPRGICVGMSLQEAAMRFRCDGDVATMGGPLYIAADAQGVAPCGELRRSGDGLYTLYYACITPDGRERRLEIGVNGGAVAYWYLYEAAQEVAYDG